MENQPGGVYTLVILWYKIDLMPYMATIDQTMSYLCTFVVNNYIFTTSFQGHRRIKIIPAWIIINCINAITESVIHFYS